MSGDRQSTGLDEYRDSNRLNDNISGNAGNAHTQNGGHDHDQQTGEVDIVVLYEGENEIAHIKADGGQGDGADDYADDYAADTDADSGAGALYGSGDNLVHAHAGLLPEPAGSYGGENTYHGAEKRRVADKHHAQQCYERNDKMPLSLQHLCGLRNIFLGKTGEAKPLRLEVDGEEQTEVVEEGRYEGRQHDRRVADAEELGHDEAYRTHYRGTELTAGGGYRLYRSGEVLLVASPLHKRNSNCTGGCHIGDSGAVYHAQESRGNYRYLRRTAGGLTHEGQREIIDEVRESAVLQECTKDNEHENVGS